MEPKEWVVDYAGEKQPVYGFVDSQELLPTIPSDLQGRLSLRSHGVFGGRVVTKTFDQVMVEKYKDRAVNISSRFVFHPNVVLMHGILYSSEEDEIAGKYCGIVMEYVEGSSLNQVIHNRIPYSREDIIRWTQQACSALKYCHGNGVVHRNVCPEVMLLNSDRQILKLAGFTCAREMATQMTANMSQVRYLAPEMMSADDVPLTEYDEKVDTFAMALSMWEMHYREEPFFGYSNTVSHRRNVSESGLRPKIEDDDQDPELCKLIVRCWHQDPNQRPSMVNILTELELLKPQSK